MELTESMFASSADYWENEAKRYAGNADYWREKAQAAEKAAERYHKLRAMVRGERHLGTGHNQGFAFPSRFELPPLGDIMRGSVAQHLDAAIDALPAVG